MDINLLLNGAESETGRSTSAERTWKDEPIQGPLVHSAESGTLRPYVSYQTQNLRRRMCTIHPISPPQRHSFSPQEDALMQYMIDNIQSGRVKILSMCLKRSLNAINTRWDVLYSYEPCPTCIQCRQFQKGIDRLRRNYRGSNWTITHYFLNTKIYVAIPPPRFIEKGEKPALPIVVRLSGQDSSLTPYIMLDDVPLRGQCFKENQGDMLSVVFFCERLFQSGCLRMYFQSQTRSHHIDFDISCVTRL